MLDVGPDGPDAAAADHPMAGHLDVYQWLTVLQEYLVLGLMEQAHASDEPMTRSPMSAGSSSGITTGSTPTPTLGSGWASGTTVVLTPPGTVGAVDVPRRCARAPARPTCSTRPTRVRHVDAVVLTGGSAFGLAAADGVMRWLEEHGRGVAMDGGVVPIVPAAVIFDLPVGGWQCRPTAEFGYAAARERGDARSPSAPSAPAPGRGSGCSRAASGPRRSRSRHRASPSARSSSSTPRATSSTRRPGCRGWPTRSRSSAWSRRLPTRSPRSPTGTPSSAR